MSSAEHVKPPGSLLEPLRVPHKRLMGPGPSNCSPRVLLAMSLPVLGHLHPECTRIMDEVKAGLQYVFQTRNKYTMAVSASGHAGMEMALSNLIQPGERVLITQVGIWGERAADMAKRYGADVRVLQKEPGNNVTFQEIETALIAHRPVLVFMVQGDSSTGVYQPLEGLGSLCHKYECLLVVDTVASLGGVPMFADKWEIDVIYSGSQKVLGAPPGFAPISFSSRAVNKIFSRTSPTKVFYWDLKPLANYWGCTSEPRFYHHTVSSSLLYALREGLSLIAEEGIENCVSRHVQCAKRFHEGLTSLGLELFVEDEEARLPTVTTVKIPPGVDLKKLQDYAMDNFSLEISGGLGPTAGKVFRIGLMGYNATISNVDYTLEVIKKGLEYVNVSSLHGKL